MIFMSGKALKKVKVKASGLSEEKLKKMVLKEPWDVILYPHLTEKSMRLVDLENKMVFIVNPKAEKDDVKNAVEKLFNVSVASVQTELTRTGEKKAYVKLSASNSAAELASKLGVM